MEEKESNVSTTDPESGKQVIIQKKTGNHRAKFRWLKAAPRTSLLPFPGTGESARAGAANSGLPEYEKDSDIPGYDSLVCRFLIYLLFLSLSSSLKTVGQSTVCIFLEYS